MEMGISMALGTLCTAFYMCAHVQALDGIYWCGSLNVSTLPNPALYPTLSAAILVMTSSSSSSVINSLIPALPALHFSASSLHLSSIECAPPPNTATSHFPMVPSADQNSQVHCENNRAAGTGSPSYTVHTYHLKDYAYVSVNSRAIRPQDTPVIYGGEKITGTVKLPRYRLQEVQSIVVVVRRLLVGTILIELDLYSCERSIPTPRNQHIRLRWCCCPGKLILLIAYTTSFLGPSSFHHLPPPPQMII